MRKVLNRVWSVLNSPVADIICGLLFFVLGVCLSAWLGATFDPLSGCAGFVLAAALDCCDHGLDRFFSV